MIYRIFEFLINLFQSFLVTHFLIKCLGIRKDNSTVPEYLTGVSVTLIYLEILNRITEFESVGVFVYLIISMVFSVMLLRGSMTEKVFYNLIMICGIVFSSLLGVGIVGMFVGKDYLQAIIPYSISRYISALLVQIIMCMIFALIVKLKHYIGSSDSVYMRVLCVIPVISIVICCLILYRDGQSFKSQVVYTMLAIIGIVALNAISLILLAIEHKIYMQSMQEKMLLNAFEQKEKDVESIKSMQIENEKIRHEVKNIFSIVTELLDDGRYSDASEFLHKYVTTREITKEYVIYSQNIVLNYLLNRKIKQCSEMGINITCFVSGVIEGVEDVDLYILLENLLDNGIEASIQTSKAKMHLNIYSNAQEIEIEIGNSLKENVLEVNPDMKTTKADKMAHGYGLQNVRDVVKRYNGKMDYSVKMKDYIIFKIKLKKNTICNSNQ